MAGFAEGKKAWGMCRRCGLRALLKELVSDGEKPGLLVHSDCRDMLHPTKKTFNPEDRMVLRRPSPDTDDDSPGDTGESLVTALGFDHYFGGGT